MEGFFSLVKKKYGQSHHSQLQEVQLSSMFQTIDVDHDDSVRPLVGLMQVISECPCVQQLRPVRRPWRLEEAIKHFDHRVAQSSFNFVKDRIDYSWLPHCAHELFTEIKEPRDPLVHTLHANEVRYSQKVARLLILSCALDHFYIFIKVWGLMEIVGVH